MFRTLFASLIALLLSTTLPAQSKKTDYAKEGYAKAIVINYKVEGCGYVIELSDKNKTKLLPQGILDEAFRKNKLKVWVKYSILKKQPATTCMAGESAEITDIKKRK
jgi:hypothetical protein